MTALSNNHFGSQKIHTESPHAPRTPGDKGAKLLVDAQRAIKATSRKKPGRLLPKEGDNWDITIKHLQNQLAKMT